MIKLELVRAYDTRKYPNNLYNIKLKGSFFKTFSDIEQAVEFLVRSSCFYIISHNMTKEQSLALSRKYISVKRK